MKRVSAAIRILLAASALGMIIPGCEYVGIGNPLAGGKDPLLGGIQDDEEENEDEAAGRTDYTSPNIGTLKYVPAGQFQRDGESNGDNISIISEPYRMSQHEITRQQFQDIMGDDPSDTGSSSGTSDPVQQVNWYHAIAFCNKLSLEEGLTPVYSVTGVDFSSLTFAEIPTSTNSDWNAANCDWSADGYRLPTEMEWMWAAMGAEDDYTKAFAGDDGTNSIEDYAWYDDNSASKTHPAGEKPANELGLHDMSGNVYEWCWDWYDSDYPTGERTDYQGAASEAYRVKRGGSWSSDSSDCTVSYRNFSFPDYHGSNSGFRVVRP